LSLENVIEKIKENNNFLITAHVNPEGDAIGSELGFLALVEKMGKSAFILNQDDLPYGLDFIPGSRRIEKLKNKGLDKGFDCLVALDCSDLPRIGRVSEINIDNKPVINIDHHISNDNFGTVSWVDPSASSCSEMIYRLYLELGIPLDSAAALALYVGIMTDTGSFRYSNTTSFTHLACAELLKYGINVPDVYRKCYEDIPFEDMKFFLKLVSGIAREAKGKIVWVEIPRPPDKKIASFDLAEHVLNFCRAIKGVEVVVLFRKQFEKKDEVRVNFRSQGKVDVNIIAASFGGGGHKTASGATLKGSLVVVRRRVLAKIKACLK
jgi:bifunctional oligoribonuclease and PAP phosphatase NrnA